MILLDKEMSKKIKLLLKKIENLDNNILWKFFNKPLSVTIIIVMFSSILLLIYGHKDIVKCNLMINPDVNYLKDNEKLDNDSIRMLLELYSKPFLANLTFDGYQEALAFKYLTIDGQNHGKWYKPTINCVQNKIQLPINFKDIINK